jgi:hypothetical protein
VLFEPGILAELVKAKAYVRKDRSEGDEAIDYFETILPRIKAAHPELVRVCVLSRACCVSVISHSPTHFSTVPGPAASAHD